MTKAKEFSLYLRKTIVNTHCKGKGNASHQSASKCQERLSDESSRTSEKAVKYNAFLEDWGRQKF